MRDSASPIRVVYVTSSPYKREEAAFLADIALSDGEAVGSRVDLDIRDLTLKETLEVNLETMVRAESLEAYRHLLVPCIVEHAGLIFDDYADQGYPGGLTKPMWNALGQRFVRETQMGGEGATARGVIAYCDGQAVYTFVGETHGHLVDEPRGPREFYWDTVFVPDGGDGRQGARTYAEIVADPDLGLRHKVLHLSQSAKAMRAFLEFRLVNTPVLWPAT